MPLPIRPMPKKTEETAETPEAPRQPFFYPSIGQGITVLATDQSHADEIAAQVRADFDLIPPQ